LAALSFDGSPSGTEVRGTCAYTCPSRWAGDLAGSAWEKLR
jgi:hypothetical protein